MHANWANYLFLRLFVHDHLSQSVLVSGSETLQGILTEHDIKHMCCQASSTNQEHTARIKVASRMNTGHLVQYKEQINTSRNLLGKESKQRNNVDDAHT